MNDKLDDAALDALFDKIESYSFECEAGPLRNCQDWLSLRSRVRELESAPTSEEVESVARRLAECADRVGLMCSQGRPPKMSIPVRDEDDDVFISSATMTSVNFLRRLDRERQEFRRWHESSCEQWRVAVGVAVARAERAEAELARVTGERDAAVKDAERYASAIRWALGYDEGAPQFGEQANQNRYGWREELRRRAAMKEPTK